MAYIANFYDTKENRFFHVRYLYYTKKEIRAKAKIEYPSCELISIDKMRGWIQHGKYNINSYCNTSFAYKRLTKQPFLIGGFSYAYTPCSFHRMYTSTTLPLAFNTGPLQGLSVALWYRIDMVYITRQ